MGPRPASFASVAVGSESAPSSRIGRTSHNCGASTAQANSTSLEILCRCRMGTVLDMSRSAQLKALARRFAPGLLRPFSGMNVSVRLGEIAQTVLSRWPIPPQPVKPTASFCYLTLSGRANWLMLRESLFSLHRSWNSLPEITVVSDGSWTTNEFAQVFAWWPAPIRVLMRNQICDAASSAGFPELAEYARVSPYGLKLAA